MIHILSLLIPMEIENIINLIPVVITISVIIIAVISLVCINSFRFQNRKTLKTLGSILCLYLIAVNY